MCTVLYRSYGHTSHINCNITHILGNCVLCCTGAVWSQQPHQLQHNPYRRRLCTVLYRSCLVTPPHQLQHNPYLRKLCTVLYRSCLVRQPHQLQHNFYLRKLCTALYRSCLVTTATSTVSPLTRRDTFFSQATR